MTATAPHAASREEAIQSLGQSFKRAMAAVRRLRGRETHRPATPSFAQYPLLFSLAEKEELSNGDLACAADVSAATVTGMLDSLVELGLVTRSRSSTDRRIVTCSLTEAGRRYAAERKAFFESRWDGALADFSPAELATAAAVFERIATIFESYDG